MSLVPHEFIFRGDLMALGPFHSQVFVDALCAGEIVSYYVEAEGVSGFSGDWYIGLQKNGVDILTAAERPQITAIDLEVEVTGLTEAVSFRDRLVPTVDARGAGTITGPITVIVWINPTEKTTPVDADTVAITDSAASNVTKRLSWANLKATLKTYFDTLYVALAGAQTIAGVKTFSSDPLIPDEAYDATAWNGSLEPPTKNAVRDKIEDILDGVTFSGDVTVPDEVYGVGWNASLEVPTKNAVYDKIESLGGGGASDLDDLTDVIIAAPANGELIRHDGSTFINSDRFGTGTAQVKATPASHYVGLGDITGAGNVTAVVIDDLDKSVDMLFGTSEVYFDGNTNTVVSDAPIIVPDEAYGAGWDSDLSVPTKNALYDKIETLGSGSVATDAIWDAKGDLAGGTGANTAARLPVGTNGQILAADSAETTGLKWISAPGGGDLIAANNLSDLANVATALTNLGLTANAAEINTLDGITASTAELNILDGVTATAAELNALDGITATVTELNYTDGVTSAIQTQLDAKAGITTAQTLTSKKISLTAAHGSDDTYEGIQIPGLNNSGGVTQWDAVYLNGSSAWVIADANGSGTYPARGLAVTTETTGNPVTVLVRGTVRNDAWAWTPGGTIYLSGTAGGLTQTQPSTSGDKVQAVGYALDADRAYFDFNSFFFTVT